MKAERFSTLLFYAVLFALCLQEVSTAGGGVPFRRGDSNVDGTVDLSDAVHALGFLFLGSPSSLDCREATNSNGDGSLDLTDAVYTLIYLFQGGEAPPAPGPLDCGTVPDTGLGCEQYPACGAPPDITSGPSAEPSVLNEGEMSQLSVMATDPAGGDLAYSWNQVSPAQPEGTFSDSSSATPTWTAPSVSADGEFTLQVTVTGPQGGEAEANVTVSVLELNLSPEITAGPAASPETTVSGSIVTLSVTASDPDGDALTYSWVQTEPAETAGTFVSGQDSDSATWYPPALASPAVFTLEVSISDGSAPPVRGIVELPVSPPSYSADVQPIWTASCSCHMGAFPSAGMHLGEGVSYENLVNVPAGACAPLLRVLPGSPDDSVLFRKISGSTCGSRMPLSDPTFFQRNPDKLELIRSWILAGAEDD